MDVATNIVRRKLTKRNKPFMGEIKINYVKLSHNFSIPTYATTGSAGLDLSAAIPSPILIKPGERKLIPTGIRLELPMNCEGQVRARSGLALDYGVTILNGIGTIDSDFRGEVKVLLINFGAEAAEIQPGQRIAQIVFALIDKVELIEVPEISSSETRNTGGFGSTGQ